MRTVLLLLLAAGMAPAADPVPHSPTAGEAHVGKPEAGELKDLTPEGFHDLVPHDEHARHAHAPGHLTPIVPDGRGFFLNADYFLMKPRADGMDFAIRTRTLGLGTDGLLAQLRYRVGNGFRTELGYRLPEVGLDLSFGYSYFGARADATVAAERNQLLRPTLTRPGLIDSATSARASADLDVNVYDALFGRRWAVDDHLAVRGFAGVRFADITQDFGVRYDGRDARDADVRFRSRFDGAGPVAGAEGVYAWPRGFHLYARGSGGLLSGLSGELRRETNDGGRTVYVDVPYGVRKVVPTVNLGLGGGFQYRAFSVRAGYEVTHWFGLTERARFTSDVAPGVFTTPPGDLSLDGLFVQLGFAF